MPLTCDAVATPIEVRLLVVAVLCEVTMPLPVHPPPLRPDWINPLTPLYVFAEPTVPIALLVISLLAARSSFAPGAIESPAILLTPTVVEFGNTASVPALTVTLPARR